MSRILRSLISNIATFLLSLVAALAIWGVAIQESDRSQRILFEIPVQVVGLPANSQLSGSPDIVEIRVEGPTSIVEDLVEDDFTAELDVTELPTGEHLVPITVFEDINRVEVVDQAPQQVVVTIERIVTKDIPVLVDIRGEVPRGYEGGTPFLDPDIITVTGPASRVEALAEARVDIFLDFPREDVTRVRTPTFYNRQGEITSVSSLNLSTREVQITVPIDERSGFALKSVIVNFDGEPAPGYRVLSVSAEPDSVLVTGRPTQIEQVSFVGTETIDVNGLRESITVPATLNLPAGLELEEVQSVIVRVEIEPILTSDVVRQEPEIRNLGEGLTVTLDVEQVVVFVAGPFDKLESLTDDDVRVTLDLFGLVTGTHQVEPEAAVLVSDVAVRSIHPTEVTVVITSALTTTAALTETTQLPGRLLVSQAPTPHVPSAPLVMFAAAMLPAGWGICQRWKRKQPCRKNH